MSRRKNHEAGDRAGEMTCEGLLGDQQTGVDPFEEPAGSEEPGDPSPVAPGPQDRENRGDDAQPPDTGRDGGFEPREQGDVASQQDGGPAAGTEPPPPSTRFQPGRSGNPRGRPRKLPRVPLPSQHRRDVIAVMNEMVPVNTPTGKVKMPLQLAIIRATAYRAAKGDLAAIRLWGKWSKEAIAELHAVYEAMQVSEALSNMAANPGHALDDRALAAIIARMKRIRDAR